MHIVLMDATRLADPGPGDDHGVSALARMARREGHRVSHLLVPGAARELSPQGLSVCASCDVVHVFAAAGRLPVLAQLMSLRQPTILTLVDLPPAADGGSIAGPGWVLASASRCVVRSHHAAQAWRLAASALEARVLPRGIDLLALLRATHPDGMAPQDRAEDGRRRTLVCPGPLDERSGVDLLMRAFAAVEGANLRLQLLGAFDEGTAHGRVCSDLAAGDSRVSVVACPAPGSLVRTARDVDLVCVPGLDAQPFSLAVHEAAALGVDCLVGDHGAQAEAVRAFACGTCMAPGDVQAWTEAIGAAMRRLGGRRSAAPDAPLPMRIEEEAFLYEGLYRQAMHAHLGDCALGT